MTINTLTIVITAYNEEQNISQLLQSIRKQKEVGFKLDKIYIYSDGSTDKTVAIIKSLKSPKIVLYDSPIRCGKSYWLNSIYRQVESDILVQIDADVRLAHPHVIRDLIEPLLSNDQIGLCGGNPTPFDGTTFTEKAINCTFFAYQQFRSSLKGGNNVFSADGRLLAVSSRLYTQIIIPSDMIANDMFLYFSCLSLGFSYRYVEKALVYFRSPRNLSDQIRQNTRFRAAPLRLKKYFSPQMVEDAINIPVPFYIQPVISQFIAHPILCTYIFIINIYCKLKARVSEKYLTAKWPVAYSTKNL